MTIKIQVSQEDGLHNNTRPLSAFESYGRLPTMATNRQITMDSQAPQRRAFASNGQSFSALYTHLQPCILTNRPGLLLACKSRPVYLPETRQDRSPTFISSSTNTNRLEDDDQDHES